MGAHHRDERHPGPVCLRGRHVLEPVAGFLYNIEIVVRIARWPASNLAGKRLGALHRQWVTHRARQAAHPLAHVHGHHLLIETRGVLGVAVVELSDGYDGNIIVLKTVPPAWHLSHIGMRVVPVSNFVDVAPGSESGARRRANGTVRVGVLKASARGS